MDAVNGIATDCHLISTSLEQSGVDQPFMSFAQQQHCRVMKHIHSACRDDVGDKIKDEQHAREELNKCYSNHFIDEICQLELDEEIKHFNNTGAYEYLSFVDWYALRDYQEDGYIQVNDHLRHTGAGTPPGYIAAHTHQLKLSLMHTIKLQARENMSDTMLYRGAVMSPTELEPLEEGGVYTPPSFLSAYEDENTVSYFLADKPTPQEVNVLFEIHKTEPLAGADIAAVVHHDEGNYLFLPGTRFVVLDKQIDPERNVVKVNLRTCDIDESEFDKQLHDLIFSS